MSKKRTQFNITALTYAAFIAVFLLNFLPAAALAAIPIANADPFATGEKGMKTLIEKGISFTKWVATGGLVICIIAGMCGRFNSQFFIKVALGMAALSGLGWFVDLWVVNG